MSQNNDTPGIATMQEAEESFFQRFSRRKHEARQRGADPLVDAERPGEATTGVATLEHDEWRNQTDLLTDADMPDIESLDERSDYTGFLSAKVSESLRRAALRKLFHSTGFNVIDELDDYNEDFTTFEGLGDIVTAEMRRRDEIERRRQLEREAAEDDHQATVAADESDDPKARPASSAEPESVDEVGGSVASEEDQESMQDDKPSAPV